MHTRMHAHTHMQAHTHSNTHTHTRTHRGSREQDEDDGGSVRSAASAPDALGGGGPMSAGAEALRGALRMTQL